MGQVINYFDVLTNLGNKTFSGDLTMKEAKKFNLLTEWYAKDLEEFNPEQYDEGSYESDLY